MRSGIVWSRQGRVYRSGSLLYASCAANAPVAAFYILSDFDFGMVKIFDRNSLAPMSSRVSGGLIALNSAKAAAIFQPVISDKARPEPERCLW